MIAELKSNAVQIIDELDYCYVVSFEGQIGYTDKANISRWKPYNGGGGGGGGGGGSDGGSADGGDISLSACPSYSLVTLSAISQSGEVTGKATVKADETEVLLCSFDYEETVPVVVEAENAPQMEGCYTVWVDDVFGFIRKEFVQMPGETAPETWEGYSKWGTEVKPTLYLEGETLVKLNTNTKVTVLRELDTSYFIQVEDVLGFANKENIQKTPYYTGGGSDDGGSGGGGGGEEWSPPAL